MLTGPPVAPKMGAGHVAPGKEGMRASMEREEPWDPDRMALGAGSGKLQGRGHLQVSGW